MDAKRGEGPQIQGGVWVQPADHRLILWRIGRQYCATMYKKDSTVVLLLKAGAEARPPLTRQLP